MSCVVQKVFILHTHYIFFNSFIYGHRFSPRFFRKIILKVVVVCEGLKCLNANTLHSVLSWHENWFIFMLAVISSSCVGRQEFRLAKVALFQKKRVRLVRVELGNVNKQLLSLFSTLFDRSCKNMMRPKHTLPWCNSQCKLLQHVRAFLFSAIIYCWNHMLYKINLFS